MGVSSSHFDSPGDTLFRDPHLYFLDQRLYMIFNVQVGLGSIINAQDSYLAYAFSEDLGKSWTTPKRMDISNSGNKIRIVAPFNESVNVEGYHAFGVHWREEGKSATHASILLADFQKDTFFIRGDIQTSYRIAEPALIAFSNHLTLYLRTDKGAIQYTRSFDNGFSWEPIENTALDNPYSLSVISRIGADSLLVIWNNDRRQRNYLSIGICLNEDLSGMTWKHLIQVKNSAVGQVSYPSYVRDDDGSFLISYTDRRDIGRDSLNRLITRADIRFHQCTWQYAERIENLPEPLVKFTSSGFVNDLVAFNDSHYYCGDLPFIYVLNNLYDSVRAISLTNTPYIPNNLEIDSSSNALICAANGGWYIRYDFTLDSVTHQKRFSELGAYNIQGLTVLNSNVYVSNLNGDVGIIRNPDSAAFVLNTGSGKEISSLVQFGNQIFTCGDYLEVNKIESEQLYPVYQSSISYLPFRNGFSKDSLNHYFCGDQGSFLVVKYDSLPALKQLPEAFNKFNYIAIDEIADSLLLLLSDQDIGLFVNTNSYQMFGFKILPENEIGRSIISKDSLVHIVTERGNIYAFDKDSLRNRYEVLVKENKPNGVGEIFQSSSRVFPNPTRKNVFVESENLISAIRIFNALGVEMTRSIRIDQERTLINLEGLPAGYYLIQLELDNTRTESHLLLLTE